MNILIITRKNQAFVFKDCEQNDLNYLMTEIQRQQENGCTFIRFRNLCIPMDVIEVICDADLVGGIPNAPII